MAIIEAKKALNVDVVAGLNWAILLAAVFMSGYLAAKDTNNYYGDAISSKITIYTLIIALVAVLGGAYQYFFLKDKRNKALHNIMGTVAGLFLYILAGVLAQIVITTFK